MWKSCVRHGIFLSLYLSSNYIRLMKQGSKVILVPSANLLFVPDQIKSEVGQNFPEVKREKMFFSNEKAKSQIGSRCIGCKQELREKEGSEKKIWNLEEWGRGKNRFTVDSDLKYTKRNPPFCIVYSPEEQSIKFSAWKLK